MLKTEAERRAAAKRALGSLRLEGLEPDGFGKSLMEQVVKGTMTIAEAIQALNQSNQMKRASSVKVA